jgi:hypothetical protein
MAKTIADYLKEDESDESPEKVKVEKTEMEFNDMRLLHLFEKVFEPGYASPAEGETHIDRTMKRLACFKQLLAALK